MRDRTDHNPEGAAKIPAPALLISAGALAGFALAIFSRAAWEPLAERVGYAALVAAFLLVVIALAWSRRRRATGTSVAPRDDADRFAFEKGAAEAVIDESALEALRKLGDESFVSEVISQFVSEGVLLLMNVARAVGDADAAHFASQVHALRSSAANVGAKRLYRLCLDWRDVPGEDLAISGSARFVRLQQEFDAAQRALKAWQIRRQESGAADCLAPVGAGWMTGGR